MILKKTLLLSITLISFSVNAQKAIKLKPTKSISVSIPEPSDICYNPKTNTYYIVSDTGILYETDENCKVLKTRVQKDTDFEAVYTDGVYVYAVDESNRTVYKYDNQNLELISSIVIAYNGGRNKGYESLDFNPEKNKFILITESNPVMLFELDLDFKVTSQKDISDIASDISSARYYNNFLWLLSDEDMMLLKVDPSTYKVLQRWKLPVINPEGLAFDKNGDLLISCDDMQRVYYFNNPEKK